MCVYTHTYTCSAHGVLECESRGWDDSPGEPDESRWTKSRHKCICICVQSTHVCIYICWEAGWDLGLIVFFFNVCFLPKKKGKRYECNTEISNLYGFDLLRPSRVLNYFWSNNRNHHEYTLRRVCTFVHWRSGARGLVWAIQDTCCWHHKLFWTSRKIGVFVVYLLSLWQGVGVSILLKICVQRNADWL